jgi:hypothetical protein
MDSRLARGAAAAALVVGLALALPKPALADDVTCAGVQTALNNASISVIHITESDCPAAALTVPAGRSFTLTGAPTTFHGNTGSNPILNAPSALGTTTFSNLTFRDASGSAAVAINPGPSATFTGVQFLGNTHATGPAGLDLRTDSTSPGSVVIRNSVFGAVGSGLGNSASGSEGAGLEVQLGLSTTGSTLEIDNSTFGGNSALGAAGLEALASGSITLSGNTFQSNTSASNAGGAFVAADSMTINGNQFIGNAVVDTSPGTTGLAQGGGLQVSGLHATSSLSQTGNLFQGNSVRGEAGDAGRFEGGGELMRQGDATLSGDRFIGNSVQGPPSAAENAGGAVFDDECGSILHTIKALDLLVAGNSIATAGEGAGIYVGCSDNAPRSLQLFDSTVSGNSVAAGGSPGAAGSVGDALVLRNTIVAGNSGGPDIDGFGSTDAQFSDACGDGGVVPPGTGNFCANPLLTNAGAGDITQTPASPTRDHGFNALVPAGLTTDVFGAPRIQGSAVDIGAQEFPVPPPPDTTPPSITGFSLSNKRFRVGSANTPVSAVVKHPRARKGTRISWVSSEPATASFKIQRVLPGRKVKRKGKSVCVKPKRSLSHKKRCNRFNSGLTLTRHAAVGPNTLVFTGRVNRKALKPGHYRVSLTETDAAGNSSKPKRLIFTIVKR